MPGDHSLDWESWRIESPSASPSNSICGGVVLEIRKLRKRKSKPTQKHTLLQILTLLGEDGETRSSQLREVVELDKGDVDRRVQACFEFEWSIDAVGKVVVHLDGRTIRVSVLPFKCPQRVSKLLTCRELSSFGFESVESLQQLVCEGKLTGHVLTRQGPAVRGHEEQGRGAWNDGGRSPHS